MLQCERCELWVCLACTSYKDIEYKVLADRAEFHWFCPSCEKAALQAVHVDQEIEEKCAAYMSQMTSRIENLERDKADKQIVEEMGAKIEELAVAVGNKPETQEGPKVSPEEVARVVREEMAEKDQIEAKKLNIILQNISEYNPAEEQPKSDLQKIHELLEQLGTPANITSVTRMGKPQTDHPRTIKASVSTLKEKKAILAKARTLREKSVPEHMREIYIRPDLTAKQQQASKNLRAELKDMRDKHPQYKWTIHHNQVIKVAEEGEGEHPSEVAPPVGEGAEAPLPEHQ